MEIPGTLTWLISGRRLAGGSCSATWTDPPGGLRACTSCDWSRGRSLNHTLVSEWDTFLINGGSDRVGY